MKNVLIISVLLLTFSIQAQWTFNITSGTGIESFPSTASGSYSTAMGSSTTASGTYSTAMGIGTTASGFASTAMGSSNTASGFYSTTMGAVTTASGNTSTAMGFFTSASDWGTLAIGHYNTADATPNPYIFAMANRAFIIGNGTAGSESDAFTVLFDGSTTIAGNVTAPFFVGDGSLLTNIVGATDDQMADVFQLNGNDLELSLEDDGAATQTVDLSGYLDNTDNQNIYGSGLAANILTVGISGGTSQTVDLSSLDDAGTDDQIADVFQLNGNDLELSLENDGAATQTVDLSVYLDNTDNQNISGSGLAANILTVGISGGASQTVDLSSLDDTGTDDQQLSLTANSLDLEDGGSVDLSGYLDNTDNQNISGSGLAANILTIGISGGTSQTVDLSSLDDAGTDNQLLSLTGNFLDLEDGGSVDLSGYLDNTDNQNISGSGLAANILTVGISGGASQTVDLSSLDDAGTDDQVLSLTGNSLDLEDGGSVDLSGYLDNTDNQVLTTFTLEGTVLKVEIEDGNTLQVDISPILATLEQQMIDVLARLEIIEDCACDGTLGGLTDFGEEIDQPRLFQNIPNPFNNTTSIGYFIPFIYSKANIVVSTTTGKILNNISISKFGEGNIDVNKVNMQSAVYFYTLFVDGKKVDTKRMIVE